jgi:putative membrane protein
MMGFGFGGASFFLMLLFWVVVIAVAIWLLSSLFPRATGDSSSRAALPFDAARGAPGDTPSESALEILKHRYARGEISKSEYEEMRRDLVE